MHKINIQCYISVTKDTLCTGSRHKLYLYKLSSLISEVLILLSYYDSAVEIIKNSMLDSGSHSTDMLTYVCTYAGNDSNPCV